MATETNALDEGIDWAKFLPTSPLADTGDKEFSEGQVWAWGGNGAYRGSVFRIGARLTVATWERELLAGAETALNGSVMTGSPMARTSLLIRHADGRWADGYTADGPIANRPARTVPFKSSSERPPRKGDWYSHEEEDVRWTVATVDGAMITTTAGLTTSLRTWNRGGLIVHGEGPAESRKSGTGCKAPEWCGKLYSDKSVPHFWDANPHVEHGWHRPFGVTGIVIGVDETYQQPAYCSQACADAPAKAAPVESPASKPAEPSACTFACSEEFGTHGPKCVKFVPERLMKAREAFSLGEAKMRTVVGAYDSHRTDVRARENWGKWIAGQTGLAPDGIRPAPSRNPERSNVHLRPRWTTERNATVTIQDAHDPDFCLAVDR